MKKKTGFTLIELLVVIAIIALLMSILMPALARVKTQAKGVICQSRLKQWATAFSMYSADFDGYNPYGGWASTWWHFLLPYVPERKIFACPMATKTYDEGGRHPFQAWSWGDAPAKFGGGRYTGSYGVNPWIFSRDDVVEGGMMGGTFNPAEWRWKRSDVKGADKIPVFGDASGPGQGGRVEDPVPEFRDSLIKRLGGDRWGVGSWCLDRHNCGVNIIFMDWSLHWVGARGVWKLQWHRQYKPMEAPPNIRNGVIWPEWLRKCSARID